MGWFGPRGLASIVLMLITLNDAPGIAGLPTIAVVVSTTVLLSVFAHGITANPAITWYARENGFVITRCTEAKEVREQPTRTNILRKQTVKG